MKKVDEKLPSVIEDAENKELTELSADEEMAAGSEEAKELSVETEENGEIAEAGDAAEASEAVETAEGTESTEAAEAIVHGEVTLQEMIDSYHSVDPDALKTQIGMLEKYYQENVKR